MKYELTDAMIRSMVNDLRDVARTYHSTEQLRDRISHVVHEYLQAGKQKRRELVCVTDRSWEFREFKND